MRPLKPAAMSMVRVSVACRVCAASGAPSVGAGGRFTVADMVWVALPVTLAAVTVTVAVPAATPVSVITEPARAMSSTAPLLEVTV